MIQEVKWLSQEEISNLNRRGWKVVQVIEHKVVEEDAGYGVGSPFCPEPVYNKIDKYLCLIEIINNNK